MNIIVLASHNKGKIKEFQTLLQNYTLSVQGLEDFPHIADIAETGTTFLENALIKAKTVAELTGHLALADDSGLCVQALNGAPGVYSARYSGENATDEKNNKKLLKELFDTAKEQRQAHFVCSIVIYSPCGKYIHAEEYWQGTIAEELKGANGFGYDPLFIDNKTGLTAAELSADEKNTRSHRAKALKSILSKWDSFYKSL